MFKIFGHAPPARSPCILIDDDLPRPRPVEDMSDVRLSQTHTQGPVEIQHHVSLYASTSFQQKQRYSSSFLFGKEKTFQPPTGLAKATSFICMIALPLALAAVQTVLSRRRHRVQQQHKFGIAPSQPLLISIQDAVMQITWWADIDSISILLVLNWAEQPR